MDRKALYKCNPLTVYHLLPLLLSGLQTRRFPTSNMYMDDLFCLNDTARSQPIYSNTSILRYTVCDGPGGKDVEFSDVMNSDMKSF